MDVDAGTTLTAESITMTIEAFADTILPGEKRFPGDHAVAGAAIGGGAVAAGALEVLRMPESGLAPVLPALAMALNGHAQRYAAEHGLASDASLPPLVALPFAQRTELVTALTDPAHPERELWIGIAMFSTIAFDAAAHLHTVDALAAGHPGLTTMGYAAPAPDGSWRFPAFSYGRKLADVHPNTTPSGSPA